MDGLTTGNVPAKVGAATEWKMFVLGRNSACGIQEDGDDKTLWCTGSNDYGQIGDGTTGSVSDLTQIGSATNWQTLDVGVEAVCGIRGGKLYCWGMDHDWQLGLGSDPSAKVSCDETIDEGFWDCLAPELVNGTNVWTDVSVGATHACAITGEDLYCWGMNSYGQAGQTVLAPVYTPTKVAE